MQNRQGIVLMLGKGPGGFLGEFLLQLFIGFGKEFLDIGQLFIYFVLILNCDMFGIDCPHGTRRVKMEQTVGLRWTRLAALQGGNADDQSRGRLLTKVAKFVILSSAFGSVAFHQRRLRLRVGHALRFGFRLGWCEGN